MYIIRLYERRIDMFNNMKSTFLALNILIALSLLVIIKAVDAVLGIIVLAVAGLVINKFVTVGNQLGA